MYSKELSIYLHENSQKEISDISWIIWESPAAPCRGSLSLLEVLIAKSTNYSLAMFNFPFTSLQILEVSHYGSHEWHNSILVHCGQFNNSIRPSTNQIGAQSLKNCKKSFPEKKLVGRYLIFFVVISRNSSYLPRSSIQWCLTTHCSPYLICLFLAKCLQPHAIPSCGDGLPWLIVEHCVLRAYCVVSS